MEKSIVSEYFCFNKPIIFVSSNRPLIDKEASGRSNLISAIKFIDKEKIPGTFVAYKNPNENFVSFYLGSDVEQINNYDNKLNSITRSTFCIYDKKFIYTKKNTNTKNISFKKFNKDLKFSNKILIIHPYPGINYGYLQIANRIAELERGMELATANIEELVDKHMIEEQKERAEMEERISFFEKELNLNPFSWKRKKK